MLRKLARGEGQNTGRTASKALNLRSPSKSLKLPQKFNILSISKKVT